MVRSRSPLTLFALFSAATVSFTCSTESTSADEPEAAAISAGGESDLHTRADTEAVAEALAEPRERDLRTYTDEGALGLRIPVHDPSGRALDGFYAGLERARLGRGKARITVWGASHVAADVFTGYLREHLQSRFGDGGHGFILPAQPWRYYRHRHIDVESNYRRWTTHRIRTGNWVEGWYGYAGVAVESSRSDAWGAITTAESGPIGRHAGLYELWYLKQPSGGEVDVLIDGRRVDRVSTAGETLAAGYAAYQVEDGPHRFEVRVRGNGPVRIFGTVVERETPGVVVDTLGINGARVQSHLYWNDALYREHLARRAPDMVVLAYGTNESGDDDVPIEEYEERLRQVVARVREVVPSASCLLVGPTDRPLVEDGVVADRPRTTQLVEVQRRVAEDTGCGFYDLVAFMGGPLSMQQWIDAEYGRDDYVHFTVRGYERLGVALLDALLRDYPATLPDEGTALAGR